MTNVYLHLKANELLVDKYKEKKAKNPAFSIRSWAHQMGFKSHGALQQILAGKRTLPKKYLPQISNSLSLATGEAMYLETLVDFEKAKTSEEKDLYYKRLNHLRPTKKEVKAVEIENYKYFQNPLHSIIRVMTEREDFKNDAEWIKNTLRLNATQREIKEVIERLISLGFAKEVDGKLVKTHRHIKNKVDTPSSAVQEYHRKMSLMAAEQVKKQSIDEREFNSFCMNIKKDQFNKAQEKIRSFVDEFMDEFEADKNASIDTYQLNVQLFSLTNKTSGESL